MKYVEAMRLPVKSAPPQFEAPNHDDLDSAAEALEKAYPSETGRLVTALDNYIEQVEDHFCDEGWSEGPQLVPVGSTEDLDAQMERAGFLRAEEVAIVRLADLKALQNRRIDARALALLICDMVDDSECAALDSLDDIVEMIQDAEAKLAKA